MYLSERWGWRDGSPVRSTQAPLLALCAGDWGALGPADAWNVISYQVRHRGTCRVFGEGMR